MSDTTIAWYRTRLDPAVLKDLTRRSDAKGLAQGLAHLAVVAATAFFTWWSVGRLAWPLVIAAFFVHGTVLSFLGGAGAMHELSHGTPFKTRWLNEVFLAIASFLTWSNPALFRASHARHHLYTVHHGLDLEVVLPGRFRLRDFLWQLAFNPVGVYEQLRGHVRLSLGILEGEWENRILDGRERAPEGGRGGLGTGAGDRPRRPRRRLRRPGPVDPDPHPAHAVLRGVARHPLRHPPAPRHEARRARLAPQSPARCG